jgi:hypothetical protein
LAITSSDEICGNDRWKKPSKATAASEYTVIAHLVGIGKRDQGSQSAEQVEGLEDEVGGSLCIRPGSAQAVDGLPIRAQGETLLGERSAQSVAEQSLQALSVLCRNRLRGVEREALRMNVRQV